MTLLTLLLPAGETSGGILLKMKEIGQVVLVSTIMYASAVTDSLFTHTMFSFSSTLYVLSPSDRDRWTHFLSIGRRSEELQVDHGTLSPDFPFRLKF